MTTVLATSDCVCAFQTPNKRGRGLSKRGHGAAKLLGQSSDACLHIVRRRGKIVCSTASHELRGAVRGFRSRLIGCTAVMMRGRSNIIHARVFVSLSDILFAFLFSASFPQRIKSFFDEMVGSFLNDRVSIKWLSRSPLKQL